jgi:hypothetical protein
MKNITNFKTVFSSTAVIAITVAATFIAARGAARVKSIHERKIDKIMVDYAKAVQAAENSYDKKAAPLIRSARTIRDSSVGKAGKAIQTKLERAAKDSKRLRRPDEAKLAEDGIVEFAILTKTARATDPHKPQAEDTTDEEVIETGPLPSHVVFKGHAYMAFLSECTMYEAIARCKKIGGRLACIESGDEMEFLKKELPVRHTLWVGAVLDARHRKLWYWISGPAINRPCWVEKQPGIPKRRDHNGTWSNVHGALGGNGLSSKAQDDKCRGFICEWGG